MRGTQGFIDIRGRSHWNPSDFFPGRGIEDRQSFPGLRRNAPAIDKKMQCWDVDDKLLVVDAPDDLGYDLPFR